MMQSIGFLVFLGTVSLTAGCAGTGSNPHALAHMQLAAQALQEQDPELARRHLELALQHDPRNARALSALGVLHYLEGENRRAAWFFEESVRMRPDFPEAHANWGALLLSEGKLKAAVRRLFTALYYDPGNDAARWNLALAFLRLGNYRSAAVHLGWYCARAGHPRPAVKLWIHALHASGNHKKAEEVRRRHLPEDIF